MTRELAKHFRDVSEISAFYARDTRTSRVSSVRLQPVGVIAGDIPYGRTCSGHARPRSEARSWQTPAAVGQNREVRTPAEGHGATAAKPSRSSSEPFDGGGSGRSRR